MSWWRFYSKKMCLDPLMKYIRCKYLRHELLLHVLNYNFQNMQTVHRLDSHSLRSILFGQLMECLHIQHTNMALNNNNSTNRLHHQYSWRNLGCLDCTEKRNCTETYKLQLHNFRYKCLHMPSNNYFQMVVKKIQHLSIPLKQ